MIYLFIGGQLDGKRIDLDKVDEVSPDYVPMDYGVDKDGDREIRITVFGLKSLTPWQVQARLIQHYRPLDTELIATAFMKIAHYVGEGKYAGWWDTLGQLVAKELGDRLVESKEWERHEDGEGHRLYYRRRPTD